jgi:hypothetical protein
MGKYDKKVRDKIRTEEIKIVDRRNITHKILRGMRKNEIRTRKTRMIGLTIYQIKLKLSKINRENEDKD